MSIEQVNASWKQVRPLSRVRELAAVWMFVKRDFMLQAHFRLSYLTGLMETVSSLVIFGMIARFGQSVPAIEELTGGYINFVISGMVLNTLLATALSGPYMGWMAAYWNNQLEIILASPLRFPVFVTGLSAGRYVDGAIRMVIYLIGGTLLLGFTWPAAPHLLSVLGVLMLALLACTGLGLLGASTIYTLDARGGQDPVRLVVETVSGLAAGVYFPLQVLPTWAQWLAHLVPHTYAIDGIRRALFGAESIPPLPIHTHISSTPLVTDCMVLALYALMTIPLGWKLFLYGMNLARKDGRFARWM